MPVSPSLKHYLAHLSSAEHVPRPDNEEWAALINRISVPGRIADVHEESFYYFLEVLPPQYQSGAMFALQALDYIEASLRGDYDVSDFMKPVNLRGRLDRPGEHERCPLCV